LRVFLHPTDFKASFGSALSSSLRSGTAVAVLNGLPFFEHVRVR
jgi:hypothetical protein